MTLPANIRINVGAPFPAQVRGSGPFSIARKNGIWTLGASFMPFAEQAPPLATALPTDYLLAWDSIAGQWVRVSLATVMRPAQRAVTAAPVTIQPTDCILHFNLTAPTTITLPSYTSRNGLPLILKDVGLQAFTNPLTFFAALGEAIDGLPSIPLNTAGQALYLTPANDGVNTGWWTE